MTKSSKRYDLAVIGGGIIGLVTAMRLSQEFPRHKIIVLEKESRIAQHQTGHNSGVIHAGIYYTPGSQKANFCLAGAEMLRRFASTRGIPYSDCGKLIVATQTEELVRLEEIYKRGKSNGVLGLELIGRERLRELEPHAAGIGAVLSSGTGIIDYVQVCQEYAAVMKENGCELLTDSPVQSITRADNKIHLETTRGDFVVRGVINCAGLYADRIAQMMGVNTGIRIIPFRGEYMSLRPEREHLVKGLIYPVPDPRLVFLGVHFTKRIKGGVEAGPNAVLAFAREGYGKASFNLMDTLSTLTFPGFWLMSLKYWKIGLYEQYRSLVKAAFVRSLQKLVPEITGDDLCEPGSGVRAQAVDHQGRLLQDFNIAQTNGAIHVLNAPSPGASSSLAIGDYIQNLAKDSFQLS